MENSDFNPFFFQTLLRAVKRDETLKKVPPSEVEKYKDKIKKLEPRAKNKLALLILQYYVYEENNGNTDDLNENSLPYSGEQTLETGVSFNWNKFGRVLQHLIARFLRAATSDESRSRNPTS